MPTPDASLLTSLGTALGAGLLIGVIYERRKDDDPSLIAGLRSHTLAALIGAVSLWFGLPVFAVALLLTGAFVALGYYRTSLADPGVTSELALVLTCLIGGLSLRSPAIAAGLAVLVSILIFAKSRLHYFSREVVSQRELADGLVLLAFALVVLPLLPDRHVDPWGLVNPSTVWKLAVLVMAISALGHVALRLVGTRWGLLVAGFFSGYVSSTAATAGFGRQSKAHEALLPSAVGATMLANLASLSLFVPILWAMSPRLLAECGWILGAAGLALALLALSCVRRGEHVRVAPPTSDTRMFRIGNALGFAAMITVVMVVSKLLGQWLGPGGALAATFLAALAELQSAVAGVASLYVDGVLGDHQVHWAIVGLLAASALAKSLVAFTSGGKDYGLRVAGGLAAMTIAAAAAALLR